MERKHKLGYRLKLLFGSFLRLAVGLALGQLIASWVESSLHNTTLYDAIFIESWKEKQ